MQLTFGLSSLLVSILCATSLVDARPAPQVGSVTLPLRSVARQSRSDVHPHVLYEQHRNRAIKRHALMTGREAPSDEDLAHNILKRAAALEARGIESGLKKRLGMSSHMKSKLEDFKSAMMSKEKTEKLAVADGANGGQLPAGGAAAAAAAAATPAAAAAGAADPAAATPAAAAAGADLGGPGFPAADLAAAMADGLTQADAPKVGQTLGLAIQANDVGYIASVTLGTPGKQYNILMDSGSADFWVGADNCVSQAGGGCGPHTFLGPAESTTFVDLNTPFAVQYGQGNVAGDVITDNVNIAGLALTNHTFGVATSESVDFSGAGTPFDGLMGVAQSTLSQQGVLTPVESLAKAGVIQQAIISFHLARLSDGDNDGEVTFGAIDPAKFVANTFTTFQNVNPQGFWEGNIAISVDGTDLGLQGRTAILDTGTSLMIAPPNDAAAFHAAIPGAAPDGQGGFTIPCTTTAKVAFTFNNQAFTMNPLDLLFVPVDPNNLQGQCVSALSSGVINGNTEWLLGDAFLKNVYFSTNVNKNEISLGAAVAPAAAT